ncbi:hypothetical protein ABEV34_05005 [Methylorubrum rhodesianum]|uniref:hypothetical protein n=1 Tax=Methylorubrum rhodesianum TaxID=29427 RepID=UPI003D27988B
MIPVWPADLPQRLLQEGYSYGFADGRLKTAMESGVPKMRRRFSSVARPVSGQFLGSEDDMARLERFYDEETGGGALPFLMPDQTRDGLPLATEDGLQLLDDQGRPLINTAWWLVMFGDTPPQKQVASGTVYRISLTFTVLP